MLAIVALPLVFGPPIFSHDAYSYAAHGWLIHNHLNPYQVGPGTLPGYYADQVAWVWRETTAPYGPLSLWLSHGIVILARFDPFLSAVLMRVPALIGVGLIGVLVPRIARKVGVDPAAASWFAVLNPILVIDFIGGAHNDSLMTGLMLLGIWLTMRYRRWWLGALVVGVAASIKQPAFLAAVALPFLVTPWDSWRPCRARRALAKAPASLAIAVAVFAGISVVSGLGFGWINAINVPGMVDTVSPFTVLGHIVQFPINLLGLDPGGRTAITVLRGIGWIVAVRRHRASSPCGTWAAAAALRQLLVHLVRVVRPGDPLLVPAVGRGAAAHDPPVDQGAALGDRRHRHPARLQRHELRHPQRAVAARADPVRRRLLDDAHARTQPADGRGPRTDATQAAEPSVDGRSRRPRGSGR